MPGRPQPGKPYRQEYLYNVAENMAQIVATNETVTVTAGTFTGCVKTREWSMMEAGTELKWYARGVGVVKEVATSSLRQHYGMIMEKVFHSREIDISTT